MEMGKCIQSVNFQRFIQAIELYIIDYSINEYYQKIADIIGYQGEFTHDLSRPTGMQQKLIDDTRLKKFGWQCQTPLEQGIRKTYDYFLNEVDK